MARDDKNNVDYFPHPCRNNDNMTYIEDKYRNDGYATWYKLLEKIGDAQYHFLDLQDEIKFLQLAGYCKIDESRLKEIIQDLVRLGEFDKAMYEQGILFNEKFINKVKDAYSRRKTQIVNRSALIKILIAKTRLNVNMVDQNDEIGNQNAQSKVKESKLKQSKENSIESFFFKINGKVFNERVSEWLKREYKTPLEAYEMQNKKSWAQHFQKLCDTLDLEKNGYEFNNNNHIWNSFNTLWKQLTEKNNGHNKKTAANASGKGYSGTL